MMLKMTLLPLKNSFKKGPNIHVDVMAQSWLISQTL